MAYSLREKAIRKIDIITKGANTKATFDELHRLANSSALIIECARREISQPKPTLEGLKRRILDARIMKRRKRRTPVKGEKHSSYTRIWRVVDGAVRDCMEQHPDYFDDQKIIAIRESLNKRIAGAIIGYAVEQQKGTSDGHEGKMHISDMLLSEPARNLKQRGDVPGLKPGV